MNRIRHGRLLFFLWGFWGLLYQLVFALPHTIWEYGQNRMYHIGTHSNLSVSELDNLILSLQGGDY
jgi:hypothetical protein